MPANYILNGHGFSDFASRNQKNHVHSKFSFAAVGGGKLFTQPHTFRTAQKEYYLAAAAGLKAVNIQIKQKN